MYPIKEIISVKNYALDKTYLKDIDYVITKKGNFKLTENTSIPNLNPNNFYLDEVDGPVKVMVNNDKSDKNRNGKYFLYGEEDTFTKYQLTITYKHDECWHGVAPLYQGEKISFPFFLGLII